MKPLAPLRPFFSEQVFVVQLVVVWVVVLTALGFLLSRCCVNCRICSRTRAAVFSRNWRTFSRFSAALELAALRAAAV